MVKRITLTVAVLLSVIATQTLLAAPLPNVRLPAESGQNKFAWQQGQGIPGVDGVVNAVTTWSPDANGQQPELLVVGGSFTIAGNVLANHIAAWDGNSWRALGSGLGGAPPNMPSVSALTVYNGQLIAAGWFTTAGGVSAKYIAAWDGSSWHALGSGMNSVVRSLTVYNGQLIAGGDFTTAGGVSANYIATWDGSSWQAMGSGMNSSVHSLTVYNGQLIAGGRFLTADYEMAYCIAQWDGSSWQVLGGEVDGIEYPFALALTVYNGQLIAAGEFGDVNANNIAAWDGSSWQMLGSGMGSDAYFLYVYALTLYNGQLIAGGNFTTAGGVSANSIAAWDGSSWQALGSGVNRDNFGGTVYALTVYNGQLIAGGGFTTAGGVSAENIARWDGNSWQALGSGMDSWVNALTVYNGQLIAGGGFTTAGSLDANYIAAWDYSSWQALGSGMDSWVNALTVYNGQLIAGGDSTTAGGVNVSDIAAWDGNSWQALGSGTDGPINALTVYNGQLVAGGEFTTAGGVIANYIAAWDGTNWRPLGSGMDSWVYALTVYNGQLIAGGGFTTAGGVIANNIAVWDGSSWQALECGMNWGIGGGASVSALTVYDGQLIVGGDFTTAGGADANYIAAWDGNTWQPLGIGMGGANYPELYISALTVYNGQLIAGGNFTTAGGVDANYIAAWDGNSWQPLGSGMGGTNYPSVYTLTVYNGQLIAGGAFTTAGGKVSAYWARWGLPSPIPGDLNHDSIVNETDLELFVAQWLKDDCEYNGFCGEADLDYNREVGFLDFAVLANHWLERN